MDMHQIFVRSEEWRAAHAAEVEFADITRALRTLAHDLGLEPDATAHMLAKSGLDATLAQLSDVAGADIETRFTRLRASGA